jgi:hypothetical protein
MFFEVATWLKAPDASSTRFLWRSPSRRIQCTFYALDDAHPILYHTLRLSFLRVKLRRFVPSGDDEEETRFFFQHLTALAMDLEKHVLIVQFHLRTMWDPDTCLPAPAQTHFLQACDTHAFECRARPFPSIPGPAYRAWFTPLGRALYRCHRDEAIYRARVGSATAMVHWSGISLGDFLTQLQSLYLLLRYPQASATAVVLYARQNALNEQERVVQVGLRFVAPNVFHVTALETGDVLDKNDRDHRVAATLLALVHKFLVEVARALQCHVILTERCTSVSNAAWYATPDEGEVLGITSDLWPQRVAVLRARDLPWRVPGAGRSPATLPPYMGRHKHIHIPSRAEEEEEAEEEDEDALVFFVPAVPSI